MLSTGITTENPATKHQAEVRKRDLLTIHGIMKYEGHNRVRTRKMFVFLWTFLIFFKKIEIPKIYNNKA